MAATDVEPLCCCEYRNRHGERAHVLGLLCDCEDFDRMADGLICGRGVDSDRMNSFLSTAEDRLRIPWPGGAIQPPIDKVLPVVLVPSGLWLCALHPIVAAVMLSFLPFFLYIFVRALLRWRPGTKFCLWISYTTAAYLLYVYEVKLVGLFWDLPKLVSPVENLVLVSGTMGSLWCFHLVRSGARPRKHSGGEVHTCRFCGVSSAERDHHCVWLDTCISATNKRQFLAFLLTTSFTALHLALILSSAACPGYLLGPVVLPDLCWPDTSLSRLHLVAGAFAGLISLLLLLMFLEHVTRSCRRGYRSTQQPQLTSHL